MPIKIEPSAKQKRNFWISFFIYILASAVMLLTYNQGTDEWVYPWPAWIVAAWGLVILAQYCVTFHSVVDPWLDHFDEMCNDIDGYDVK